MTPNLMMDQWVGMNTTYGYEISVEKGKEKAAGLVLEEMYGEEEDFYLFARIIPELKARFFEIKGKLYIRKFYGMIFFRDAQICLHLL